MPISIDYKNVPISIDYENVPISIDLLLIFKALLYDHSLYLCKCKNIKIFISENSN